MTLQDLEADTRRHKGGLPSTDDLVALEKAMYQDAIIPGEENDLKKKHLDRVYGNRLDTLIGTCLDHLLEIDHVHRWYHGSDTLIIHVRRDDVVNDENLEELLDEELNRLLKDLEPLALADGGESELTKREVVAEELDVALDEIEDELKDGADIWDRQVKFQRAVEAIEDHDHVEKTGDYAPILVINNPYRYELTEKAVRLAEA